MLVQHLLGVVTVLLTFGIGRLLFGVAGGLVAALLTAISGPVIVTEHYLMSEALFTLLLMSGLLATSSRSARSARWATLGLLALAGAMLGLAALTRPIAQLIVLILAAGLPFLLPRWRPALTRRRDDGRAVRDRGAAVDGAQPGRAGHIRHRRRLRRGPGGAHDPLRAAVRLPRAARR